MMAESSNDFLVVVPVGEVLTVPQCLEIEKPSIDVIGERSYANNGTKGCVTLSPSP